MTTGIIYLAKNTISSKCYIGKTTRGLDQRKREHLTGTIKASNDFKFARALRKYPLDSWEWSILVEAPIEELDSYERFFIKDLDTYKQGYNSNLGGDWFGEGNPKYDSVIYELWHPEHGIVKETITDLYKRSNSFTHIQELLRGSRQHIAGYILPDNIEKYNQIVKTYDFYHPNHGVVTCTAVELFENYKQYFNTKECYVYNLTGEKAKLYSGWCLAKHKDNYENLLTHSHLITLTHPEHGTLTLRRSEFKKRFGLTDSAMSFLKSGRYRNSLGWEFVNNELNIEGLNKIRLQKKASFKDLCIDYIKCKEENIPTQIKDIELEYPVIGEAYKTLGSEKMKALKYRKSAIEEELLVNSQVENPVKIVNLLDIRVGEIISKEFLKMRIQAIYDQLGIKKKAKATDINNWYTVKTMSRRVDGEVVASVKVITCNIRV